MCTRATEKGRRSRQGTSRNCKPNGWNGFEAPIRPEAKIRIPETWRVLKGEAVRARCAWNVASRVDRDARNLKFEALEPKARDTDNRERRMMIPRQVVGNDLAYRLMRAGLLRERRELD